MNRSYFYIFLGLLIITGCYSKNTPPDLFETQKKVSEYIEKDYNRDFSIVVDDAKNWLNTRTSNTAEKLAIVLDIDETSLSNWRAYKLNNFARIVNGPCDLEKGPCGIRSWQAMGISPALDPTVELVKLAKSKGISVFFISARPPDLQEATENNLRTDGYQWDKVIIQKDKTKYESAVDFKMPERKKLTEEGYTIILCMGDQQSDLSGGYCEKTFKLPNPVYFLP